MVLELCLGGELFAYLARQPRHCVSPSSAQFYAACVISAIEHMHSKDICYRDMKPENMLIDDRGFVKVRAPLRDALPVAPVDAKQQACLLLVPRVVATVD